MIFFFKKNSNKFTDDSFLINEKIESKTRKIES